MLSKSFCRAKSFSSACCTRQWEWRNTHRRQSASATVSATGPTETRHGDGQAEFENAKPFKHIPGPKGLPYIGTLLQYTLGPYSIDKYHEALLLRYHKYGKIFKETISGSTTVHLFDPEYVKVIYQHEGKIPHIPPLLETTQLYRKLRGLSPGLGNTNGEEWYRLRSAVQQMMMRPKAVTMYLPLVDQVADSFIDRICKNRDSHCQVPDFRMEVSKWNLESSGMTCFEKRLGCFEAEPGSYQYNMIEASGAIFSQSLKLKFSIPWFKLFSTKTWKKLVEAEDYFFGNGQKLVDETVGKINELMEKGELREGQYGFLTYLLSRKELSYKDISIISLSLFGDGLSTTVPTLIGQLYCLAKNQDVQNKLYKEICQVVPENEPITQDIINNLPYLKACVKEGFRFFPIGTEVSRIPQKNLMIGGYQVPAGTHVELNSNMLLRLPEYFSEPDKYLPERWLRDGSGHNIHPYLLTPFGHGPRMCAGRRFAEQEMYVVITKILQKFSLAWHQEDMAQQYNMLLKPDKPAQFTFIDR